MTDGGLRLCWRVADETEPRTPGTVVEACGRCRQPVLVDRFSSPDPPGAVLALVCVRCALADPELRGDVLKTWKATALLGSALPPAFKRNH